MEQQMDKNVCGCMHHKMLPLLVVVFAITFLLGAFDVISQWAVSIAWPIVVGVAGLSKLMEGSCKCC